GRRVRVHGKIETRDGKPEIVVAKSEDLALVAAKKRDEHEERVTQAQTEAIERLGDVLTHIEDLTERLVATEERVETLLAQLEQKSTRLNSSHRTISYAVFCLKKKKKQKTNNHTHNPYQ